MLRKTTVVACWSLLLVHAADACRAADPPSKRTPVGKPAATLQLLVPAYFYPAGDGLKDWERLLAAARDVPIVAIANPASGPGERADANHAKIIGRAARAGVKTIGYVSTRYAKKPLGTVKAEVDRWLDFYPSIGGVFFDEQAGDAAHVEYYRDAFAYAREKIKNGFVASNPGVPCDVGYVATAKADLVCVFENHQGFDAFQPPAAWGAKERPHAAALAYGTMNADQMRDRARRAADLKLGYFYATDDNGANPWDRLPGYWEDEVKATLEINGGPKSR